MRSHAERGSDLSGAGCMSGMTRSVGAIPVQYMLPMVDGFVHPPYDVPYLGWPGSIPAAVVRVTLMVEMELDPPRKKPLSAPDQISTRLSLCTNSGSSI